MDNTPTDRPDPDLQRQREIYHHIAESLRGILPAPLEGTPEAWAHRDRLAFAAVASLLPGNAVEADLAVHEVAAIAHASDCIRQAADHAADPHFARSLRSQAARLGCEARASHTTLLRVQAIRRKREANEAWRAADALTEATVLRQMTAALERLPPMRPPAPPPPAAPSQAERARAERAKLTLPQTPSSRAAPPQAAPEAAGDSPSPQLDRPKNSGLRRRTIHNITHYDFNGTMH